MQDKLKGIASVEATIVFYNSLDEYQQATLRHSLRDLLLTHSKEDLVDFIKELLAVGRLEGYMYDSLSKYYNEQ